MPQTQGFHRLARRVAALGAQLPAQNPNGDYTTAEQDQIRAYRILVHAECEHYFEQLAAKIVTNAANRYQSTQQPNKVLNSLRQTYSEQRRPASDAGDAYNKAVAKYRERLKDNHGLKEANLCKMFLPLGVDEGVLDVTWLAVMNTFGSARGVVAHTSAFAQQVLDPNAEMATVTLVINGIRTFDAVLQRL